MTLPDGFSIRLFQPDDAPSLSAITQSSIRRLGLRYYSHEQVQAWASRRPSAKRFIERAEAGALILVATAGGVVPIAYALIEDDSEGEAHLDMLYCHHQHTRRGIADALIGIAEQSVRANGSRRIYTEASELARSAFERAGYGLLRRRDFTLMHEGRAVPIHNYAMEKRLD